MNLTVRPVTALANGASAAPVRPAGYCGRYAASVGEIPMRMALYCLLTVILATPLRASTVEQDQLAGVRGFQLHVQVVNLEHLTLKSTPQDFQKAGEDIMAQHHLALQGSSGQDVFVTLTLSSAEVQCDPSLVLLETKVSFTDDLTFVRDPKIESPRGIITWSSSNAEVVTRSEVNSRLNTRIVNAVDQFARAIPKTAQ